MRGLDADGDRIRDLRKLRALTQEDLSARAGIDVKTVRRAERGQAIDVATLWKIATTLGVELPEVAKTAGSAGSLEAANLERAYVWKTAFERGDLETVVGLYSDDAVLRYPPPVGEHVGIAAIRERYRYAIATFEIEPPSPENFRIHAAEDYVLFRARTWGTARATGRRFLSDVVHEFRFEDGSIVLEVGTYDVKSLLETLDSQSPEN